VHATITVKSVNTPIHGRVIGIAPCSITEW